MKSTMFFQFTSSGEKKKDLNREGNDKMKKENDLWAVCLLDHLRCFTFELLFVACLLLYLQWRYTIKIFFLKKKSDGNLYIADYPRLKGRELLK